MKPYVAHATPQAGVVGIFVRYSPNYDPLTMHLKQTSTQGCLEYIWQLPGQGHSNSIQFKKQ